MNIDEFIEKSISRQIELSRRVILPPETSGFLDREILVAGLDITYVKLTADDGSRDIAVPCCAVQRLHTDGSATTEHIELLETPAPEIPYVPGLLGFREVPLYRQILRSLRLHRPDLTPDVYLVDGFGTLHPRRCGSAVHLGIEAQVPTLGIAKHLLYLPDENFPSESSVRAALRLHHSACGAPEAASSDLEVLTGFSELFPEARAVELRAREGTEVLGLAVVASPCFERPIYVSAGNGVGLREGVELVLRCCGGGRRYPEALRLADMRGREYLRERYGPAKHGVIEVRAGPTRGQGDDDA